MDYYQKYLKYKSKYHNLLEKKGGALIFNDFDDANKVLLKTKMEGDILKYSIPTGRSNNFTELQKKSLEIMTNHILPHISYKGKKLGYNFVKEVETFGAGTFGVALAYDNLIIKVMIKNANSNAAIQEINILEDLYNTPGQEPPETLSKYYGFIAGKDLVELQKYDTYRKETINIASNLFTKPDFKFDNVDEIIKNILKINDPRFTPVINQYLSVPTNFFSNMILAFFDKEDGDMDKFIKDICSTLTIEQKILVTKDFFEDIAWGLNFLHRTKNKFHSDIKSANIVYKKQPDNTFKFKLIDFGTLAPIDPVTGKAIRMLGGTELYFLGTNYLKVKGGVPNFSYMYDYFCTLCVVLQIWGVVLSTREKSIEMICFIMDSLYQNYMRHGNIDKTIEELIRLIKAAFGIDLPSASSNPQIKETYEILIAYFIQGNITGGEPAPLS